MTAMIAAQHAPQNRRRLAVRNPHREKLTSTDSEQAQPREEVCGAVMVKTAARAGGTALSG